MSKFDSPLNNITVASPCPADWEAMYGDGRKRFCGDCKLNVYNLSGMTKDEAEALVMNAEGRLCVRFYRRADGSVITQDCPVGWAKVKQRTKIYATAVVSLLMALFTGVLFVSLFSKQKPLMGDLRIPFTTPTPPMEHTMGAIALPPQNTNTNSNAVQGKPSMIQGNVAIDAPKAPTKFEIGKMRVMPNTGRKDS
ncbi:MAG: hypothetical protein ACKVQJ_11175 [Pyrinomonadaceae bacterium]